MVSRHMAYQEVANTLGISVDRVQHLISEGKLHSIKSRDIGKKGATKYISSDEVAAYKQRKHAEKSLLPIEQQVSANDSPNFTTNPSLNWYMSNVLPLAQQAINGNESMVREVATNARIVAIETARDQMMAYTKQALIDMGTDETTAEKAVNQAGNAYFGMSKEGYDMTPQGIDTDEVARRFSPGNIQIQQATKDMFEGFRRAQYEHENAIPVDAQ